MHHNESKQERILIFALALIMLLGTSVVVYANWTADDRYQNASGEGYFIARKTQDSYDKLMEKETTINNALSGIAKVTISGTPMDITISVEGYNKNRDFLEFVELLDRNVTYDVFKEATWVKFYNLEYDDVDQAVSLIKDFSEDKTYGTLKFKSYTGYAKFASNTVSYTIEFLD